MKIKIKFFCILFLFSVFVYSSEFVNMQLSVDEEEILYVGAGYKYFELLNTNNFTEENNAVELRFYKDFVYSIDEKSYFKFDIDSSYELNSENEEDNVFDIESGIKYTFYSNESFVLSDRVFGGMINYPELDNGLYNFLGNQLLLKPLNNSYELEAKLTGNFFENEARNDIKMELFLFKNFDKLNFQIYQLFFRTDNESIVTLPGIERRKRLVYYLDIPYEENEDLNETELSVYYDIVNSERNLLSIGAEYSNIDYYSELSEDDEDISIFSNYNYYIENDYLSTIYFKGQYYFDDEETALSIGCEKYF